MDEQTFKEKIQEAKDVDIVGYLRSVGLQPKRPSGANAMYFSPFKEETNPSFSVNMIKNVWKDFSADKGGDVIDLVQELQHCDFKTAINILTGDRSVKGVRIERQKHDAPQEVYEGVRVEKVSLIRDMGLIEYAVGRNINLNAIHKYYKEVWVRFPYSKKDPKRIYICLGFKNDSGGWELNTAYKGRKGIRVSSKPKDITTIKNKGKEIYMFEGHTDFTSFLSYLNVTRLPGTVYVLNGAGNIGGLAPFLSRKKVFMYGHNDHGGDTVLDILLENKVNVVDCRVIYKNFSDFNNYLMEKN